MAARFVTIANNKGGVGKTTTTLNLGAGLAKSGMRVLLIDLDPQTNLTTCFGISEKNREGIGELLLGEKNIKDVIHKSYIDLLDIIPSSHYLNSIEKVIASEPGSEKVLEIGLSPIRDIYDFVIMDTAPNLGTLTASALCASDKFIIPLQAEFFAYKGISNLLSFTQKVKERVNHKIELSGILLTQYNEKTRVNAIKDIANKLKSGSLKNKVYTTYIRQNVALMESTMMNKNIFDYDGGSNGAIDYGNLIKEFLDGEEV